MYSLTSWQALRLARAAFVGACLLLAGCSDYDEVLRRYIPPQFPVKDRVFFAVNKSGALVRECIVGVFALEDALLRIFERGVPPIHHGKAPMGKGTTHFAINARFPARGPWRQTPVQPHITHEMAIEHRAIINGQSCFAHSKKYAVLFDEIMQWRRGAYFATSGPELVIYIPKLNIIMVVANTT